MPGAKIKVAIFIDSFFLPAWMYEVLQRIQESDFASICLIVRNHSASSKNENSFVYNLYTKLENKLSKFKPDAFLKRNISDITQNIKVLDVQPFSNKNEQLFVEEDIQVLQSYGADVFLKFGFKELQENIVSLAKYGVWQFVANNSFVNGNSKPGLQEVMENNCKSEICLSVTAEDTGENFLVYRSTSSTNSSIIKNANIICWKAVSFVPRKLKELYDNKEDFLKDLNASSHPSIQYKRRYKMPDNIEFTSYLINKYFNIFKTRLWKLFNYEQWILLYRFNKPNELPSVIHKYHKLVPGKEKFWADPCVFSSDNKNYFVFFEEYLYETKKAHISVVEIDKNGKTGNSKIVLNKPYHLSYPFVFRASDAIYMIPETSANKTIEIYRCISFPYEWQFEMNLMENVHAVDTTIHYQNNTFWLFTNIKENKGASAWDELFLFYSDTLLTNKWKAHPRNPVISDVTQARPAGKLFYHKNKLYRPSQDSSCTYGYATNLNEVLLLNQTEYKEKKITTIFPEWNEKTTAVHTFSHCNELTVIDARMKKRR